MRSGVVQGCCRLWRIVAAIVGAAMLASCGKFPMESTARSEELAQQAQQAGDYSKAVRLYEAILDGTAKTADCHYRLGLIYDDKLQDATSALHHFRRFLKMAPNDPKRSEVQEYIKRIELVAATRAADSGLMTKAEASRLKNENAELRQQVATLREQSNQLRDQLKLALKPPAKAERDAKGFSTHPATRNAEKTAIGSETKTYTVQKGDTLASISKKFFKTSQRWKDIEDANQNALGGSTSLKAGQVLIIPQ